MTRPFSEKPATAMLPSHASSVSDITKDETSAMTPPHPQSAAATATGPDAVVVDIEDQTPPEEPPMFCGMRRRSMFITVGIGLLILVIIIAFGVGAGIAFKT
ncbi:hypothetical protein BROUX41_004094 [Berkeleyomyces rouxiae]|uniref:uncharacterized protein n=1 Tax=Berkeleyomyces rouxiae TaxID=2035830 RepID=UPI003B7FF9B9